MWGIELWSCYTKVLELLHRRLIAVFAARPKLGDLNRDRDLRAA